MMEIRRETEVMFIYGNNCSQKIPLVAVQDIDHEAVCGTGKCNISIKLPNFLTQSLMSELD